MSFIFRSDTRADVLMITFDRVVTDEVFVAGFAAVKDFLGRHGPGHGIADFSFVRR